MKRFTVDELSRFLGQSSPIDKPIVIGDTVVFTDGRIVVRVLRQSLDGELPDNPVKPAFASSVARAFSTPTRDRIYSLPGPLTGAKCDCCRGRGRVKQSVCEACEGRGVRECNLGHEHGCDECDKKGWVYDPAAAERWCSSCMGTGLGRFGAEPVIVDEGRGGAWAPWYLAAIKALGVTKFCTSMDLRMMRAEVGGCDVALMGRVSEEVDRARAALAGGAA